MSLQELTDYILTFPGVSSDFPFDNNTKVFRIKGKIFLLTAISGWYEGDARINVKCKPEYALELREQYPSIIPGYHMNKRHWNTLCLDEGELKDEFVYALIHDSYILVKNTLPRSIRENLA